VYYSTPVIYTYEGKRYTVLSSWEGTHSVEVETGKQLWLYEWDDYLPELVADPLIFDNKVFITMYYEKFGCVLLDIEGENPKVLWKNRNLYSDISSPVIVNGYIYGCKGGPWNGYASLRYLDV
jgi:outer membrane protein assembly factor BamB